MTMRFLQCLKIVLGNEGGYSDHASDRGGATNHGVTQKTYNDYLRKRGLALRSVAEIEDAEVADIYEEYWRAAHCAYMPEPLDLQMFDAAIQHSPKRAIKLLQRTIGVDEDGICGRNTITALHEDAVSIGVEMVCQVYLDNRAALYDRIIANDPSQSAFAAGWMSRVDHMREYV